MKYIVLPLAATFVFILVIIWTLNYKEARMEFRDMLHPKNFHTLDN